MTQHYDTDSGAEPPQDIGMDNPQDPSTQFAVPSGSYLRLPAPGSKQAPRPFTGDFYEIEPFIDHYIQLCLRWGVTNSAEKYKGLLQYCDPKIARTMRTWLSHQTQDYNLLIKNIKYFY